MFSRTGAAGKAGRREEAKRSVANDSVRMVCLQFRWPGPGGGRRPGSDGRRGGLARARGGDVRRDFARGIRGS